MSYVTIKQNESGTNNKYCNDGTKLILKQNVYLMTSNAILCVYFAYTILYFPRTS